MKKFLISSLTALAAFTSVYAQKTVEQVVDYSGFRNLEVKKDYDVQLCNSDFYSVKILVDERIADYVIATVNNNTLILDLDEKSFPKELKKELKSKNAIQPVLQAKVYAPTFTKISLYSKACISAADNIKSDEMIFELFNSSSVRNVVVDCKACKLQLANKASGRFDIYCNEAEYLADNAASSTIKFNTNRLICTTNGSSTTTIDGEFSDLELRSRNYSRLNISGSGNKATFECSSSSVINADALSLYNAEVDLSNSAVCKVNAKDNLKVQLLGSSHLIYNSAPVIEVERIVNSTMTRSSDTKYNKNK